MKTHVVNGGRVAQHGNVYRLSIPPTSDAAYADAQLDDYDAQLRVFANEPPRLLRLRARFSSNTLKGTAGFGFWNAPFGQQGQVLAGPRNLWFFHASADSDLRTKPQFVGHGFSAAMLDSPSLPMGNGKTARAFNAFTNLVLGLPGLSRVAMRAAQAAVRAQQAVLPLDLAHWHDYELDWRLDTAVFKVDDVVVLRAAKPPNTKLGFVAWIDNYKAVAAAGRYAFGYVACECEQWLELAF